MSGHTTEITQYDQKKLETACAVLGLPKSFASRVFSPETKKRLLGAMSSMSEDDLRLLESTPTGTPRMMRVRENACAAIRFAYKNVG